MNDKLLYYGLFLLGVLISSFAQLLLKKNANRKAEKNIFTFIDKKMPSLAAKINNGKNGVFSIIGKNKGLLSEYLNPFSIIAYSIFIGATLLTIFSYKVVPLSVAPILGATEYFFIAIISRVFLKEKINAKKAIGLVVIFVGILVYSM